MRRFRMNAITLHAAIMMLSAACIPYTVATTATPLPVGQRSETMSAFVMPSIAPRGDTLAGVPLGPSHLATQYERRFSIDEKSDAGVRGTGGGIVVNYKRLLTDTSASMPIAAMTGFGIVNVGQHAHFELSLIASRRETQRTPGGERRLNQVVPYGGLRIMQVAPLNATAVHDSPTAGGFFGVKFGTDRFGLSPEIGVFYDRSALGVREGNIIIVPAISAHGRELISLIGDVLRGGSGGRWHGWRE
jgi:hypothetical protein